MIDCGDEVDVAVVLGCSPEQAATVVDALSAAQVLCHGVATTAAAAAARWGVEIEVALGHIAGGRALGEMFSDYELRAGQQEAESELHQSWISQLQSPPGRQGPWQRLSTPHGKPTDSDRDSSAVPASDHAVLARRISGG